MDLLESRDDALVPFMSLTLAWCRAFCSWPYWGTERLIESCRWNSLKDNFHQTLDTLPITMPPPQESSMIFIERELAFADIDLFCGFINLNITILKFFFMGPFKNVASWVNGEGVSFLFCYFSTLLRYNCWKINSTCLKWIVWWVLT